MPFAGYDSPGHTEPLRDIHLEDRVISGGVGIMPGPINVTMNVRYHSIAFWGVLSTGMGHLSQDSMVPSVMILIEKLREQKPIRRRKALQRLTHKKHQQTTKRCIFRKDAFYGGFL